MQRAAAEMNFEEAATYRDLIQSVRQVTERQKITSEDFEDRDIVAMARRERGCSSAGVFYPWWKNARERALLSDRNK